MSDVPTNDPKSSRGGPPTHNAATRRAVARDPDATPVNADSIEAAARAAYQAWKNWGESETDVNWERLDDSLEAIGRLLNANVR